MNQDANNYGALRRMLNEIADLAENASLTGSLASGAPRAVQRYNAVLAQLVDSGSVPTGLFETLNVEATDYGQLGVDAKLLASYVKGKESGNGNGDRFGDASVLIRLAPFIRGEDLAMLIKEQISKGTQMSSSVITALAPFLGSDQLGSLIRENMIGVGGQAPSQPAPAPSQPAPPSTPSPAPEQPARDTLEDLAAQLSRPELSRDDRDRIAARLSELARGNS